MRATAVRSSGRDAAGVALGGALLSLGALIALFETVHFRMYGESYIYYAVASGVGAALATSLHILLRRSGRERSLLLSLLLAASASLCVHNWALDHGWMGGEYMVPGSYHPAGMTSMDLLRSLADHNPAVVDAAWVELESRAAGDRSLILLALQRSRELHPETYIEFYRVHVAATMLANAGDVRVVPILQDMLRSRATVKVTRVGELPENSLPTCEMARTLLAARFTDSASSNCAPTH